MGVHTLIGHKRTNHLITVPDHFHFLKVIKIAHKGKLPPSQRPSQLTHNNEKCAFSLGSEHEI